MRGDGFLDDPDSIWNRNHEIAKHLDKLLIQKCLVLSGEPGLGKSVALEQAFPGIDHTQGGDAKHETRNSSKGELTIQPDRRGSLASTEKSV